MDQYISTIIGVGGCAVGVAMVVCIIWYVIKDVWNVSQKNLRD